MVTQTVWGQTHNCISDCLILVLGNLYYSLLLLPADVILGEISGDLEHHGPAGKRRDAGCTGELDTGFSGQAGTSKGQ